MLRLPPPKRRETLAEADSRKAQTGCLAEKRTLPIRAGQPVRKFELNSVPVVICCFSSFPDLVLCLIEQIFRASGMAAHIPLVGPLRCG